MSADLSYSERESFRHPRRLGSIGERRPNAERYTWGVGEDTEEERAARAAMRRAWPIRAFRLGQEPGEDLSATTTAAERLAMMWALALLRPAGAGLSAQPRSDPRPPPRESRSPIWAKRTGLNEDFRELLAALEKAGAVYLVVGAHALAVH